MMVNGNQRRAVPARKLRGDLESNFDLVLVLRGAKGLAHDDQN